MRAPARLGLFGLALVVAFAVAAATARAVVPDEAVRSWTEDTQTDHHATGGDSPSGGHDAHEAATPTGLSLEQDGYRLTGLAAPGRTGTSGDLTFSITRPDGSPLTDYTEKHEQDLHLVVVRSDGQEFRHVHPELGADGTWSLPWSWGEAGTYRVYADFTPADADEGMTLSSTVQVAGDYTPVATTQKRTATAHGYEVSVEGDLDAGRPGRLTLRIERQGEPVTSLEPYLGAAGHLVALREGDLAYLHVHPEGDAPTAAEPGGPEIDFETTAPTAGRYLLYLDFKDEGRVHSVPLIIDTEDGTATPGPTDHEHGEDGQDH